MLKYVRIFLVLFFCLALAAAVGLYAYIYTHEDTKPPAFRSSLDLVEVSMTDPPEALMQGLSAYDNVDGDVTAKIRVKSISTLINDTDVNVEYIVFDNASNYAVFSRTVRYRDYTSPRFHMLKPMIFNVGETVSYAGAVAVMDQRDGNISGRLKLEESTVISSSPGSYTAKLSATNRMGDTIYLPLTVQILDNSASRPKIALKEYLIYLERGQTLRYRRFLQEVKDPLYPDKSEAVPLSLVSVNDSNVDPNTPGVYEVYYYYTGISGEIATVILTVIVE